MGTSAIVLTMTYKSE